MVDLKRDLVQRRGRAAGHRSTTDDPDPSYLRIAVLNRFTDNEWSSGDREVPGSQTADGAMPGAGRCLRRADPSQVRLPARGDPTSSARRGCRPRADQPDRGARRLALRRLDDGLPRQRRRPRHLRAQLDDSTGGQARPTTPNRLARRHHRPARWSPVTSPSCPPGSPRSCEQLAMRGHRRGADPLREGGGAAELVPRRTGGFTYSTDVNLGNGTDDLVRFLSPDDGGRTGYCEQFAAAMAVMARELGIPARVAVGFLEPEQPDDRHLGLQRARPARVARAVLLRVRLGAVRAHAADPRQWGPGLHRASGHHRRHHRRHRLRAAPTPTTCPPASPTRPCRRTPREDQAGGQSGAGGVPWVWVAGALVLVRRPRPGRARPADAAPSPPRPARPARPRGGLARAARHRARPAAVAGRSPARRGRPARRWSSCFGAPRDEFTPERPRRGPDTNPDAVFALDRIVHSLERLRYARDDGSEAGTWRAEMQTCVEALYGGAPKRARRAADWWPRSVFNRPADVRRRWTTDPASPRWQAASSTTSAEAALACLVAP